MICYSLLYLQLTPLCHVVLLPHRTLEETLELLEKQVQCPICLETYRDPKALSCLHAYCRECIQQLLVKQQRDQEVECPQCRSVVAVAGNDPTSLPTVFFINGLIEVYHTMKKAESNAIACQNCSEGKSTSFCHTCGFVCSSCINDHKKKKVYEGHKTVMISEMREGQLIQLPTKKTPISTCQKHKGKRCKLYCFKCEQLICRDCTLVDHAGHKLNFVGDVADTFREEVLSSLGPLRNTHASVTTAIARVEDSKKEIRDQGTDIATTITHSFKELRTIFDKHEQLLLQQAREVVGRKVGVLDRQQEDLQLALATLNSLVEFIESTAENASDEEFISMKQQMTSQVEKVGNKYTHLELAPAEVANIGRLMPQADSLYELCKQSKLYVSVVDVSKCDMTGPGLKFATTNHVSKFTVCTYDTHNQPLLVKQHVSAELKSLVDGSVLQATVVSQTPSTYELSYTPTTRGHHQLTIQVNNTEVGTFQVFVQHPPNQLDTPVRVIEGVKPYFVAVGDKGELFVTEHQDCQYTVLDAKGQRVLTIGSNGKPPFEGGGPTGISKDSEGNVYVASYAHKVQKFNSSGEVVKSVGKNGRNVEEFSYPCGVQYHNHQVYVCDSNNGRVQVFDSDLNFVRSFGTNGDGPGQLMKPRDIDFDAQGNSYVVNSNKYQVLVFSEDGQYLRHFGREGYGKGELNGPKGLYVSSDYVYVTECWNHRVSVFHTSGEFVHSFGKLGSGRGELWHSYGITVDKDGFVFVCDHSNSCIQVF